VQQLAQPAHEAAPAQSRRRIAALRPFVDARHDRLTARDRQAGKLTRAQGTRLERQWPLGRNARREAADDAGGARERREHAAV